MVNLLLGGQRSRCVWGARYATRCEVRFGRNGAKVTIYKLAITIDAAERFPHNIRFTKKSLVGHQLQQFLLVLW